MYLTSTQLKLLSESELSLFERQFKANLPREYCKFMNTFGNGTYGGVICINSPDFNTLKGFSDYGFWQHENAPITQEQIEECVVIGNSIDGDFIAIHSNANGYILLPRHSETIAFFPFNDEKFIYTVNKIAYYLYHEYIENYFEPVGSNHIFLHSLNKDLQGIAQRFKLAFRFDYLIENDFTCEVFLTQMGGYVRFNLSIGSEIAVFYSNYGKGYFQEVRKFLVENGCN